MNTLSEIQLVLTLHETQINLLSNKIKVYRYAVVIGFYFLWTMIRLHSYITKNSRDNFR